jgi:nucleoside-diphosphate-sugar epimerase
MAKTIAVIGATGAQGGGVVTVLLKSGDWKVRAITCNTGSDKAKALASSGAEVVAANADDLDSLVKAFEVSELSPKQNTLKTTISSGCACYFRNDELLGALIPW